MKFLLNLLRKQVISLLILVEVKELILYIGMQELIGLTVFVISIVTMPKRCLIWRDCLSIDSKKRMLVIYLCHNPALCRRI